VVMKRILLIIGIIVGFGFMLNAQTMVGLSKEEVTEKVKKDHRKFRKDASVIKQRFNYLKYVNGIRTKTWILYFTEGDTCKTSKMICDYSELNDMVGEINEMYEQKNDSIWEYPSGSELIQVELIRQEWYFTIRKTRKK
jgi:hypothetical protein